MVIIERLPVWDPFKVVSGLRREWLTELVQYSHCSVDCTKLTIHYKLLEINLDKRNRKGGRKKERRGRERGH